MNGMNIRVLEILAKSQMVAVMMRRPEEVEGIEVSISHGLRSAHQSNSSTPQATLPGGPLNLRGICYAI